MGIKKAKTKEVRKLTAAEAGGGGEAIVRLERVYAPRKSKQTVMIDGSAREQAARLVEILRREVRVLSGGAQ
ncbi:MAG: hypothetical protein R2762_10950 [Bryobacteraceae bacterium]